MWVKRVDGERASWQAPRRVRADERAVSGQADWQACWPSTHCTGRLVLAFIIDPEKLISASLALKRNDTSADFRMDKRMEWSRLFALLLWFPTQMVDGRTRTVSLTSRRNTISQRVLRTNPPRPRSSSLPQFRRSPRCRSSSRAPFVI